jgi:hypothetical protein
MSAKVIIFGLVLASCVGFGADVRHTPERGSVERQAICDGARAYIMKQYMARKLPQAIVFRIDRIEVMGDYGSFEGVPLFKDGSYIGTEYIQDVVFNFGLKRSKDTWSVLYDLSRTDVPDDAELKKLWKEFPKEFPFELVPKLWREMFGKVR